MVIHSKVDYVLMTAAFNEEAYIETTIRSVVQQTLLPQKWIVVSDGSTDNTDRIIQKYTNQYKFIELLRIEKENKRTFCSKVRALNAGYSILQGLEYNYIGNLDADIDLTISYFEKIIAQLEIYPELGIASGVYVEKYKGQTIRFKKPKFHTPGAIQVFRRECYEKIGGYPKLEGGEDTAAGVCARMHGWQTRSFKDIEVTHLKPLLTGNLRHVIKGRFRLGWTDFLLGMHPLYAVVKLIRQLFNKPFIIGGLSLFIGFLYHWVFKRNRSVSKQFVEFFRKEQFSRLKLMARLSND